MKVESSERVQSWQMEGQSGSLKGKAARLLIALAFTFGLSSFTSLKAAFLEPYWSARVASLGGAYTALADDPTGIFYNPAAGIMMKRSGIDFSYAKLMTGLDTVNLSLGNIAYARPMGKHTMMGIGWSNFSATNLYRENTVLLSLARSLKPMFPSYEGEFSIGASMKFLMRDFTMTALTSADPLFKSGSQANAAAIDLHLYAAPSPAWFPGWAFGLTVRSVNTPDIGYQSKDKLPMEVVGGLVYTWRNISLPVDVSSRNGELSPRVGAELKMMGGKFALRLGGDMQQIGTGLGYIHDFTENFGVVFDYAFLMPMAVSDSAGSHRATLGIKF